MNTHQIEELKAMCNQALPIVGLGLAAQSPYVANTSTVRSAMSEGQATAGLVPNNPTVPPIISGLEFQMAETTTRIMVRKSCTIIQVIAKQDGMLVSHLENHAGSNGVVRQNDVIVIVREDDNTLHHYELTRSHRLDPKFGFNWIRNRDVRLVKGGRLEEGTILASSPGVTEYGTYSGAISLKVLYADHLWCGEDGVVMSESATEALEYTAYQTVMVGYGNSTLPKNTYGSLDTFKAFPNVGDTIRPDGVVVSLFNYQSVLAPATMNKHALLHVDHICDNRYRAVSPGMKVVRVDVMVNKPHMSNLSPLMMEQLEPYIRNKARTIEEIMALETDWRRHNARVRNGNFNRFREEDNPDVLKISAELQKLIVNAGALHNGHTTSKVGLNIKQRQLPPVTVIVTLEKVYRPVIGSKGTEAYFSSKGVVTKILPDDQMPGGAHIMVDTSSGIKRMNTGRQHSQYVSDVAVYLTDKIRTMLKWRKVDTRHVTSVVEDKYRNMRREVEDVFNILEDFYTAVVPQQAYFIKHCGDDIRRQHLEEVLVFGIILLNPANNLIDNDATVEYLEERFQPPFEPLSFVDERGILVKTSRPMRAGHMGFILVNKVPQSMASAAATSTVNQLGLPGTVQVDMRRAAPISRSSTRIGNAELSILLAACGPEAFAELMDESSNPKTTARIIEAIYRSPTPGWLTNSVDRRTHRYNPAGNKILNHDLMVAGVKLDYIRPDVLR